MSDRSTSAKIALLACAVEVTVFGLWASRSGINADEGFYLAAGRGVSEGASLYGDFFFPQMPYLPWLLGGLFRLTGPSLMVGRFVGVLGAGLSAGLLAWAAWRQERRLSVVGIACLLYLLSAVLLRGLPVAKSAGLVNACLLAAFVPLLLGAGSRPAVAFASGLAAGCAIGLRLAVAPVTLLFAVFALRASRGAFVAFVGGGLLASVPWLVTALRFPDEFWFCNVAFHGMRSELPGLGAILSQKWHVLAKWLFLPQHVIVWSLVVFGMWHRRVRGTPALACVAVLSLGYLAATPTYLEYMTQIYPFAVLAALPGIARIDRQRWAAVAIVGVYSLALFAAFRSPATGTVLAAKRDLWSRARVLQVSESLRTSTRDGEQVLSWWEGYPVLSGRLGIKGVGFWQSNVAKKLPPSDARRFHVMPMEDLRTLIASRKPAAVVVPDGVWTGLRGVIEAGYTTSRRIGAVQIYLRTG